jgi:hypothetical protein
MAFLGFSKNFDHRFIREFFQAADNGQPADQFGNQAKLLQIFRLNIGKDFRVVFIKLSPALRLKTHGCLQKACGR